MRQSLGIIQEAVLQIPLGKIKSENYKLVAPKRSSLKTSMESLINHFNKKIQVKILVDEVKTTPAIKTYEEKSKLLKETESAMMKDDFVKTLIKNFDAQVVPTSIEPLNNKGK